MTNQDLAQLRERLYRVLRGQGRADATMDLLDALSSNQHARTPIELTLAPEFRRRWPSLPDAVDGFFQASRPERAEEERARLDRRLIGALAPLVPPPRADRPFWLWAVDSLPVSRPYATCLEDRTFVHQSTNVPGHAPITVGHEVSLVVALMERAASEPAWSLGMWAQRVPSTKTASAVAADQIRSLATDRHLPWANQPQVVLADSRYSSAPFLVPVEQLGNVVVVCRLRNNRRLFHPPPPRQPGQRGRPRLFGSAFRPSDSVSWGEPDAVHKGQHPFGARKAFVQLEAWHDLILLGSTEGRRHRQVVNVVRVTMRDEQGEPIFSRDLWLVVVGQRRASLDAALAYELYRSRFDQEHLHRFLRQRLMLDAHQTSLLEHEENWHRLVLLAHAQLVAARHLAQRLPRPWEGRRASLPPLAVPSPTLVQRDFSRILALVGTPAAPPKPRGKSPGRFSGQSPGRRTRHPVVRTDRKAA